MNTLLTYFLFAVAGGLAYPLVDTGQNKFYGNDGEISEPVPGERFFGQDANHAGNQPSYTNNGDGTITDNVTGLMWQQGFEAMTLEEATRYAVDSYTGNHTDWRLPSIKELYSLILFSGVDASNRDMFTVPSGARPFIDTDYFDFEYAANGERVIDTQYLSSSIYQGLTMRGDETVFGVNMADGRIKGYPVTHPRTGEPNTFSVKLVRGNPVYGINDLADNADGTVSDFATGLMWVRDDSARALDWSSALAWAEEMNRENHLGYDDWRVPDAKELHSIIDYRRSPQTTASAAIDPMFGISEIADEQGGKNFPCFWSSTTHLNTRGGASAVYICFGEALGFMPSPGGGRDGVRLLDVHGAGAQRSDPKEGNAYDYPRGHGPQGDVVRIEHHVRLVRNQMSDNR